MQNTGYIIFNLRLGLSIWCQRRIDFYSAVIDPGVWVGWWVSSRNNISSTYGASFESYRALGASEI